MSRVLPFVIVIFILYNGCDPFGSDETIDPIFEVSITGEFTEQLQGRASFGTIVDPATGMVATIIILMPSDDAERGINISGLTNTGIAQRSYPIIMSIPRENPFELIGSNQFAATYIHNDSRYSEKFESQLGEISFTHSSENRLSGSFSFVANGYRTDSGESNTDEVTIMVEGSFTAGRGQ
jgi:hypothetical protein